MPGGGGGSQSTVQRSEPPKFIQPYLEDTAERANELFKDPNNPNYYPNSTVVPLSNETNMALDMITQRAQQGNPLTASSSNQLNDTISGKYLQAGNPGLQGAIDMASEGILRNYNNMVAPGVDAGAMSSGRFGSGMHQLQQTEKAHDTRDQLRKVGTDMAYQNYGDERQRMLAAMSFAPQVSQMGYTDAQQLAGVGGTREAQSKAEMQDAIDRWSFDQNKDQNKLNQYISQLTQLGGMGGTTTTTGPKAAGGGFGSSILGGIGGAASGLGLAGSLSSMGLMAAGGPATIGLGILGGLGGLFG